MKGAELVVKALEAHGVDTVFGYPGGNILELYDRLAFSNIKHILNTHEQYACHSADGYARATGKTGVVIATSGPGATNLVTGIANAYMDSVPLVAITGNVSLALLGHDAFQEIDIAGVTMPITKHNYIVKSVDDLADILRNAFRIAQSGRKGPVLVDIPSDIFSKETKNICVEPLPVRKPEISDSECEDAIRTINESVNPFLCVGGGVIASHAEAEIKALADLLDCPVAVTAMGKGSFDAENGKYAGVVGMGLSAETSKALSECDLFIAAGARFSEKLVSNVCTFAPEAKILHFDIDIAETGKNADYFSRVVGDVGEALRKILPSVKRKKHKPFVKTESESGFYKVISKYTSETIVTTEVGLHQISAVNGVMTEIPRTFLTSGGLGTMGFGLPAGIGATIATGKTVINIAGDGSFGMNMSELSTVRKYNLPIIEIIMINRSLGMIEKMQNERFDGRTFECKLPEIGYGDIAKGFGMECLTPKTNEELDGIIKRHIKSREPCVILYENGGEKA